MSSANIVANAPISATSFTSSAVPGFIGDGSGLIDISSTSITLNNANYPVITNSSKNLTTEQYLATSRGGFGINPTTLSGAITVTSGVIGNTTYTNTNTASTIVQRDASGNFIAGNVTVTQLISNPATNGQVSIQSAYVSTTNATATTLFTLGTVSGGPHGSSYLLECEISLADTSGGVNSASYYFIFKVKNIGGTLTLSSIINQVLIYDGTLNTTAVSLSSSSANALVQVTGIASTTINWCGLFKIIQVNF